MSRRSSATLRVMAVIYTINHYYGTSRMPFRLVINSMILNDLEPAKGVSFAILATSVNCSGAQCRRRCLSLVETDWHCRYPLHWDNRRGSRAARQAPHFHMYREWLCFSTNYTKIAVHSAKHTGTKFRPLCLWNPIHINNTDLWCVCTRAR